jgi:RNA polymerase sigma-70 factor (ECF subfamily)
MRELFLIVPAAYNGAMTSPEPSPRSYSAPAGRFATTRWSVIAAAQDPASPQAQEALALLCSTYWYPLYAYIRSQGYSADQSQDLTQGFFAGLLEQHKLEVVDRSRGKFRSFLLTACKHYLAHERDRAQAQKRGGGRRFFSLDFAAGETRYQAEPTHARTPERLFARDWALMMLDQVLARLRGEFTQKGKQRLFDHLRVFLLGEKDALPYGEVARKLGMTEGTVKVAAHRLRQRLRELVCEEIARTVDDAENIDEEIRELFAALAP